MVAGHGYRSHQPGIGCVFTRAALSTSGRAKSKFRISDDTPCPFLGRLTALLAKVVGSNLPKHLRQQLLPENGQLTVLPQFERFRPHHSTPSAPEIHACHPPPARSARTPGMAARRWTAKELKLPGLRPDAELARQLQRTLQAIACQRSLRRLPPFHSSRPARPLDPGRRRPPGHPPRTVRSSLPPFLRR
jgi:hypothetical protein